MIFSWFFFFDWVRANLEMNSSVLMLMIITRVCFLRACHHQVFIGRGGGGGCEALFLVYRKTSSNRNLRNITAIFNLI